MRKNASLTLMEQSIMLLIFLFSAAVCLSGFFWAHRNAEAARMLDQAVIIAQNAAETVKSERCVSDQTVCYDEHWTMTEDSSAEAYRLTVTPQESGVEGLGKARIVVSDHSGAEIYTLTAAWQEVTADEE